MLVLWIPHLSYLQRHQYLTIMPMNKSWVKVIHIHALSPWFAKLEGPRGWRTIFWNLNKMKQLLATDLTEISCHNENQDYQEGIGELLYLSVYIEDSSFRRGYDKWIKIKLLFWTLFSAEFLLSILYLILLNLFYLSVSFEYWISPFGKSSGSNQWVFSQLLFAGKAMLCGSPIDGWKAT